MFADSYAIHSPHKMRDRFDQLAGRLGDPVVVPIPDTIDKRLDGIAQYASQLPVIFRFTDDWRRAVRAYTETLGGGEPAERFWKVLR